MKENKDLKEKINREFATPEVPFDEWAKARCVFEALDDESTVACPVYELADNVNGRGIHSANKKKIVIISLVVALVLAVAVILGTVLPHSKNLPEMPQIFGANDITSVEIDLDEITVKENIYLFDLSNLVQKELVSKDVLKQDNSQIMMYNLKNCLLSFDYGDSFEDFYLTYQIRTYKNYEFYGIEYYSNLEKNATINSLVINYMIIEVNKPVAYAHFTVDNYDYYIETSGFDEANVLSEDNFINLLNKILI